MLRALTLAGVLTLGTMAASVAQTPQRGGTLNFTAPYGTSFTMPPGTSKQKSVRYLDIREDDVLDEAQFTAWIKQAAKWPGEKM